MRRKHLLISLFGILEMAFADPKDPSLTDETILREHFQRSQAHTREILRKREAKRQEFLDHAQVGRAGDSCLAYEVESGNCSISAAQFDTYLPSYLPDSLESRSDESIVLSASKARRAVFDQLLDRAFLNAYQPDSMEPADPHARKTSDEYRAIFKAIHLPTLLMAFPNIRVQVFSASDSAWLAARLGDSKSGILPVTMPASKLPDTVLASLAKSVYGEWSPIQRVSFGYLTCFWLDRLPSPQALEKLLPLLNRIESQAKIGSRSEAVRALRNHKESCLEEDTLRLSFRLAPPHRSNDGDPGPAWMQASSSDLPASIKSLVWTKFVRGKKDTVGPVRSDYGFWIISKRSSKLISGNPTDSATCMARVEAKTRIEREAKLLRSEWERVSSKMEDPEKFDLRSALIGQLSRQGGQPESLYYRMREQWASRSLRFTQDIEPLSGLGVSPKEGAETNE